MAKTKIRLPRDVSERIWKFWSKHGGLGCAMLSQPVFNSRGGYTLRVAMFTQENAETLNATLTRISKKNAKTIK